ncbi:MAG: hypothetical protein IT246_08030 [Bacteroidia bacterium]|nr:hypothetical protein [Bacteroidia bacterium]
MVYSPQSNLLLAKLDAFIRKYYKNQLLRGGVFFVLLLSISGLVVLLLEYFGQYGTVVRTVFFYSVFALALLGLYQFILIPVLGMFRLGKTLSYEQASLIIGKHFPLVKDKLVNTLQLQNIANELHDNNLLIAAIHQKTNQLKPVSFTDAVSFKPNLKKSRFILIPFIVYLLIILFTPDVISSAGNRLLHHSQEFLPQAPFEFVIQNKKLETPQYSDFELEVELKGKSIPNEVWIESNGQTYKMLKNEGFHFTYTFRNVSKNIPFNFKALSFNSTNHIIKVIDKPTLLQYNVKIDYPNYIGKPDETIENPGDIQIPSGAILTWSFKTDKTDNISLTLMNKEEYAKSKSNNAFVYSKQIFVSTPITIKSSNKTYGLADSLAYTLQVIPDSYPGIMVEEKADSITGKQLFFIGDASDDYGLTKLVFTYNFLKSEDESKRKMGKQTRVIAIDKKEKTQRFYYSINLNELGISAADELEYYFEVWDNDGIRGAKSTKSNVSVFKAPDEKEIQKEMDEAGNSIKDEMKEAMKESKKLQKEIKDLQLKMVEKRELTWEEKKKAEELLARQKLLQQKIENIKNQNNKNNLRENEYKEANPEILEKQKQLEKMFNEIMDDEMKKAIQDIEKMLQMQNKDAIKQEMDKMQMSNKDVEKELDRMLEQYKQLEIEKKLNDVTKHLEKLSEKQKELTEKTKELEQSKDIKKEENKKQLEQLQQQIQQEFRDIQQQLRDVEKKNEQLEKPKELADTKNQEQKANENMENAKENLNKGNTKETKKNQQNAADAMQEMAENIAEKQEKEEKEQHEEDAAALREILENTIQLSKDQEQLLNEIKKINGYNPQYVELAKQQKNTRDNAKIIEDSLLALSKRVPEISSFVNKEVTKLNDNLDKSIQAFGLRNFMEIYTRQQYAMTHANNLALMLSQILNQMQQQNQMGKPKAGKSGKGGKPKPGGSGNKPLSMSDIKKMQEELNKQLKEGLNKQGEQGNPQNKNGQKPSEQKGNGQQGMSNEGFARMAAQQMAIRQQLQRMMQQMDAKQKEGVGGNRMLEEMKKMMEQTEKELYNKKLTTEMLQRQQDILTRLLESEKAERKQEQEEKREAEQAKEKPAVTPPDFKQYIEQRNKEKELLETIPLEMQPYYREKTKEYFNRIGNSKN